MGKRQLTSASVTGKTVVNATAGLVTKVNERTFTIKDKTYRVVRQADDIKVYLGNELVFDKFNSKLSFIEWLKKLRGK